MDTHFETVLQLLQNHRQGDQRLMVAIAGAPGSGKSTLAEKLHDYWGGDSGLSSLVPMDGFHLDNVILEQEGWRHRKGAPHTFDVLGLQRTLAAIKADQAEVFLPVFDRDADHSRAAARRVTLEQRIILVEGNYLLFNQAPWTGLNDFFDLRVFLKVSLTTLEKRLMQRWLDQGMSEVQARRKVEQNDLPNARAVVEYLGEADCIIEG